MNIPAGKLMGLVGGFLVVGGVVAAVTVSIVSPNTFQKAYSVVSTPSGFYVGRVYSAPFSNYVVIKDGYILNNLVSEDNKSSQQQLTKISENSLWGSNNLYLNKDQVVFKSKVEKCSAIDKTLNPNASCPQPVPPAGAANTPAPTK